MHCLQRTTCMNNICNLFQLWFIFLALPAAQTVCGVRGAEFKSHKQLPATNKLLSLVPHTYTHTHSHKSERYKKQCSGPNPISTSRFITQAGGAKKLSQEDRGSRGGSIFQYSPVCSTGPRRYPTSSRRTRGRQMTAVSGTQEGKARGPGGGLPEPLCQRRHLYVEAVTGPETEWM